MRPAVKLMAHDGSPTPPGVAADPDRRVDLALEPAFRLGEMIISPSTREARIGDRCEVMEPRVMQVLTRLARTPGEVTPRDALFLCCWEGRIVGEDAINRVVSRLRRLSALDGGASFKLETIRQVGYRLWRPEPTDATAQAARTPDPPRGSPVEPEPTTPAPRAARPPMPDKPSIAVLPFQDLGGDVEQAYFADAVTSDIVTALSRWRWFFVIAWDSSLHYRRLDVSVADVGEELGVRYVLQGSLRRAGGRVRVSARLTDALAVTLIWAERFDRDLTDMFALQDDITEHVVAAIEPAMLRSETARSARKALTDVSALDCYYRGMGRLTDTNERSYREGLDLFREAIARDPQFALGHVGLARTLYGGVIDGWSRDPLDDLAIAQASAQTAIGLDPREALAYFACAGASLYLSDHEAALHHARQAVALNPSFAYGHWRLGQVLIYAGDPSEAVGPIQLSLRYSPYDPQLGTMLGQLALAHFFAGDFVAAERQANAAVTFGNPRASGVLAASLVQQGRFEEAARAYRRLVEQQASGVRTFGAPYVDRSQPERLRGSLRIAAEVADSG